MLLCSKASSGSLVLLESVKTCVQWLAEGPHTLGPLSHPCPPLAIFSLMLLLHSDLLASPWICQACSASKPVHSRIPCLQHSYPFCMLVHASFRSLLNDSLQQALLWFLCLKLQSAPHTPTPTIPSCTSCLFYFFLSTYEHLTYYICYTYPTHSLSAEYEFSQGQEF